MTLKGLKPAFTKPSATAALATMDAVAQEAGLPPASLPPAQRPPEPPLPEQGDFVQVNIRVRRALGDQLADRARTEGTTQKVLVCRALAAAGFNVHGDDLAAATTPRRRGRLPS